MAISKFDQKETFVGRAFGLSLFLLHCVKRMRVLVVIPSSVDPP
jgi:hypothetical protein